MANLLQRLIVPLATAAVLQAGEFSHQLHLKLKPDCLSCHAKAQTSAKLEDNLLPEAAVCAGCHKEATVGGPRQLRLKRFDHAFHLKMGNIAPVLLAAVKARTYLEDPVPDGFVSSLEGARTACAACHRGLGESTRTGEAKAHFPHMADCLTCHNKIDPPFSCETCHGDDKGLKPAFHTNDYLDSHTRKNVVKQGCRNCHGQKFTCLGCH